MIGENLRLVASRMRAHAGAVDAAADMIGDGLSREDLGAALIQVALVRRMMEQTLEASGEMFDMIAAAAAQD